MTPAEFTTALRAREQLLGYWSLLDAPVATERIARLGYDYVALDAQHGLFGYSGMLNNLLAIDCKGSTAVGLVRVEANDPAPIGRALDAGATGVIVPLIDTATQAAEAVAAVRYPPHGRRSYGPMRSALRIGPDPADTHDATVVLAMIETAEGLANVAEICATPGLDGVYVGPSDLRIALGGATSTDPALADTFEAALVTIREAAAGAGIAAGIHNPDGPSAAKRLAEGFTFATVACDLVHLEQAARHHLTSARTPGATQ
ncbi:HpcH/HpaI aldolase family protein [Streptomyces muensis]|uniref:Aldolase/citrate lyase family protein n=1 Tax=Streptomyces muensis TaxID=1077944 RepID=A0A9X1PUU4_STRM4|nr:aldolase/citrate lyase family protein [Streptomyces muensis]MCF1592954.1 aldolase/citrate lyase family protein [Streptomyces muensis]